KSIGLKVQTASVLKQIVFVASSEYRVGAKKFSQKKQKRFVFLELSFHEFFFKYRQFTLVNKPYFCSKKR
ncbi:MAG: hypothetical protein RLZ77_555, partial [Bacteroidota bacterium]